MPHLQQLNLTGKLTRQLGLQCYRQQTEHSGVGVSEIKIVILSVRVQP
jgi:hypothetical protein